jgi:pimeloyl-ACP methyl ester carboxylesterase
VKCPVLVTFGGQDRTMRIQTVRLVSDLYDAKCWRFDDLAHIPSIEPGGERHMQKVSSWIKRPQARRVTEIDQFAPAEGVGQTERDDRRGGVRRRSLFHRGHRHGFEK